MTQDQNIDLKILSELKKLDLGNFRGKKYVICIYSSKVAGRKDFTCQEMRTRAYLTLCQKSY